MAMMGKGQGPALTGRQGCAEAGVLRLRGNFRAGSHPAAGLRSLPPGSEAPLGDGGCLIRGRKPAVTGVLALGVSSPEGLLSALQRSTGPVLAFPPPLHPSGAYYTFSAILPLVRTRLGLHGDRTVGHLLGVETLACRGQAEGCRPEGGPTVCFLGEVLGGYGRGRALSKALG